MASGRMFKFILHEATHEYGTDIRIGTLRALSKEALNQRSSIGVESFRLVHPDRERVSRSRFDHMKEGS